MLDCCVVVFVTFAFFAKISFFFYTVNSSLLFVTIPVSQEVELNR